MAEQDIGAPVRALYAALNKQDAEAFNQFADEKIELIDFGLGEVLNGREAVKKYFKNWWTAFPQGSGEITNTIVVGDQVIVEASGRGKHTGPFELKQGRFEPSQQELEFNFAKICRVRDGKIVSIHGYSNAFRVLTTASKGRKAAA
jgi:ketosteroid isomerase-like protein